LEIADEKVCIAQAFRTFEMWGVGRGREGRECAGSGKMLLTNKNAQ
jgi:hypothetical protein